MQEDVIFRYKNGRIIPIKVNKEQTTSEYMNNKIRKKANKQDEKEKYFNEHFYMEDGDYYAEDLYNKDKKYWNEKEKAYDYKKGSLKKRINVIDKATGKEVAHIRYQEMYNTEIMQYPNKIWVTKIEVDPDYRRKGIATQLYKELQRRAGNEDIYFGELTPQGRKLVEKIGKITKEQNYGYREYWGRINL